MAPRPKTKLSAIPVKAVTHIESQQHQNRETSCITIRGLVEHRAGAKTQENRLPIHLYRGRHYLDGSRDSQWCRLITTITHDNHHPYIYPSLSHFSYPEESTNNSLQVAKVDLEQTNTPLHNHCRCTHDDDGRSTMGAQHVHR